MNKSLVLAALIAAASLAACGKKEEPAPAPVEAPAAAAADSAAAALAAAEQPRGHIHLGLLADAQAAARNQYRRSAARFVDTVGATYRAAKPVQCRTFVWLGWTCVRNRC